jgi:predicted oxidoreductase
MWHYTEGIHNWDPIWPDHAIRIIPGPSSLWLDATGKRFPAPNFPGCDNLETMRAIIATGYDYSWFVLTQSIIEKEFALSGSEQNPDVTEKDIRVLLRERLSKGAPTPVEKFKQHGGDFVVADTIGALVSGMNKLARGGASGHDAPVLDAAEVEAMITARDRELDNAFSKDAQLMLVANARRSRTDKIVRVAKPHKLLDAAHGPLIAVRLNILTRKTLGGLQTDLSSRALGHDGRPVPGLYAAGEVAGFGGGGVHGHNALEGTFLGGCIFSGRVAGRAVAQQ